MYGETGELAKDMGILQKAGVLGGQHENDLTADAALPEQKMVPGSQLKPLQPLQNEPRSLGSADDNHMSSSGDESRSKHAVDESATLGPEVVGMASEAVSSSPQQHEDQSVRVGPAHDDLQQHDDANDGKNHPLAVSSSEDEDVLGGDQRSSAQRQPQQSDESGSDAQRARPTIVDTPNTNAAAAAASQPITAAASKLLKSSSSSSSSRSSPHRRLNDGLLSRLRVVSSAVMATSRLPQATLFRMGARVEARRNGGSRFRPATVTAVHQPMKGPVT